MIKRTVNIAKNQQEAKEWDIRQAVSMSHEERQNVAKTIKKRVYGADTPDVRAYHRKIAGR